jgi:hypothetical protein
MKNNQTTIDISSSTKGVGYYNIEEQRITKNNKLGTSFTSTSFGQSALHASNSQLLECQQEEELLDSKAEPNIPPAPILDNDQVERCLVQLWDNGEQARQRYKLKIRLNLTNKTNVEFVANLTKDRRNFVRYIPEEGRDMVIKMADQFAKEIKRDYDVRAWLGKPHFNRGASTKKVRNQIEPNSFVGVYRDQKEFSWGGMIKIYDFVVAFDLYENNITMKQRLGGVKGQMLWINPKYQPPRPQTWAQRTGRA